jgi:superfamily II DNA or RNA helicase
VLVCVLNSAASKLPKRAEAAGGPLILVVDECHRAGSKGMSAVFKTPRQYNLGLSATPEREEVAEEQPDEPEEVQEVESFDESLVGTELGPIIYELNYRQATKPEFCRNL